MVERQPGHQDVDVGVELGAGAMPSRLAQIVRFGSMTPLGSAVLPDVYCRTARASGS